ncbi:MAG TPA: 50S ribosomal protein L15 [Bacteroidetes bacterium]|nr:50S ribosomal protein L15 [Bacteroidota bacterium]
MAKDLSNLSPAPGSVRKKRRRGRGLGSGLGKTAGRGDKGQQSRSGAKRRAWFEGGQMPIHRRLPKRGFKNIWREEVQEVNLRDLARLGDVEEITVDLLAERGLVRSAQRPVKLLGMGEVDRKYTISVTAVSASAKAKIEAAGGSVIVPEPAPPRGRLAKKTERV